MRRQTSKGTCTFCHRELSKASTTRRLVSCEQRTAMQGEIGSRLMLLRKKGCVPCAPNTKSVFHDAQGLKAFPRLLENE